MHVGAGQRARRSWSSPRNILLTSSRSAFAVLFAGVAAFAVAWVLVRTGTGSVDEQVYVALNQVPEWIASVLTPLSKLFLPLGIAVVAVAGGTYCVIRTRSPWPLAMCGAVAAVAWLACHVAKSIADRPRPYEVVSGAILRQQPAHGSSFPSSHTTVAFAIAIAVIPFIPRLGVPVALVYATLVGWSRVYLGAHYPLDVLAGVALGLVVGGGSLLVARRLLRQQTPVQPTLTPPG